MASGNPKPPGCLRFGLQRIGADSNLALARLRAFECPKPFLEGRQDNDNDDDILAPSRTQTPHPAVLAKPKQARNFKDLKGLKCRYTLGTRALFCVVAEAQRRWQKGHCRGQPQALGQGESRSRRGPAGTRRQEDGQESAGEDREEGCPASAFCSSGDRVAQRSRRQASLAQQQSLFPGENRLPW